MKNFLTIFIIFFISLIFTFSCKNEEDSLLGENFMQDSDLINCESICFDVNCSSMLMDSIINTKTFCSIGSFYDPIFGFVKANLAFQIKPTQTKVDFSNVEVVNLELFLQKYSIYGDSLCTQNFKVYRLLKDLDDTKTYYSNYQINSSDIQEITQFSITNDTLIKIQLPITLAEEFKTNQGKFDSEKDFIEYFKGIYITSSDDFLGKGCIYTLLPTHINSKMVLSYKVKTDTVKETKSLEFLVDSKMAFFTTTSHDFSKAQQEVQTAISNISVKNEVCYIQGLGGIKTKFNFSGLDTIFKNKKIAINRAKLILHIKNQEDVKIYPPPKALYLISKDSTGKELLITDFIASENIFDGKYNSNTNTYSFNITTKIQTMLRDGIQDLYLIPTPERNIASPHRVAFFGNSSDENRAILEIYYSYR